MTGSVGSPYHPQQQLARQAAGTRKLSRDQGQVNKIGFALIAVFLFVFYSRVLEFSFTELHLVLVISILAFMAAMAGGGIPRALSSPVGIALIGLTICFVLSVPLGVWRGGSLSVLVNDWSRSFMIFPVAGSLILTTKQAGKAVITVALGLGVLAVLALVIGESNQGRLQMPGGQYGNPNDLGTAMCIGMFCAWYMTQSKAHSLIIRVLGVVIQILMLIVLLKTGSRGAMVGFVVALPLLVAQYTPMGRLRLIAGGAVLLVVALLFTPAPMARRFTTVLSADPVDTEEEAKLNDEAVGSTQARLYLLRRSIEITLQHPLLGVGVGNFESAENGLAVQAGKRGFWHVTHNTYTQISSEAGIPALIIYIVLLTTGWKMLNRVKRKNVPGLHPRYQDIKTAAATLKIYLLFMIAVGFFASFAYLPFVPTLMGLIYGFSYAADREFAELAAAPKGASAPKSVAPGVQPVSPFVAALRTPSSPARQANVWNRRLR